MRDCTVLLALVCASISSTPLAAAALSPCPHEWQRDLRLGMSGDDVLQLQRYLNRDAATAISPSGPGSLGFETRVYGSRTAAAITRFQEKYAAEILFPLDLSRGTGSFGSRTRAKLNELCSASPTASREAATHTTRADTLTVSHAEQPGATIAPAGAGAVPFTNFALIAGNADVTVHSITVLRVGAGRDGAFESVVIEDEMGELATEEKSLNAQHIAVLDAGFTIPAGATKTFTVFGNMTDDTAEYDGQLPVLRVASIDASVPISGALPIDGTPQTVNSSLIIGGASAMLSSYDPGSDRDLYINETAARFSGIRITADSREDLELSAIEWEQAGSAGNADIANIETVIDGIAYSAVADGRVYVSTFTPAIQIKRGMTIDVHVRGDLLPGGANRTVKFDLRESGAVSLTGLQYEYGVGIAAGGNTATSGNSIFTTSDGTEDGDEMTPFFSGSLVRVLSGGVVSVTRN